MVQASPPAIGTIEDGYRYKGGDPADQGSWEQLAPVSGPEAAGFTSLGGGWYRGPDGGSYQIGRGGAMMRRADGVTTTATPSAPSARTEDQGKAGGYARLMADAEEAYQDAIERGYDPGDMRNATAAFLEGLPFGGLDGLGAFVRDDAGDLGRQAELQWSDAQLKAVSGAASPESEVKKNVRTFFVRPGQNPETQGARTFDARSNAFRAAQIRAANAAIDVTYPGRNVASGPIDPDTGLPTYPAIATATAGTRELPMPSGGLTGPTDPNAPRPGDVRTFAQPLAPEDTPNSLSAQGYVYDAATDTWRRNRTEQVPAASVVSPPGESDRLGFDQALARERENAERVGRAGGGVDMALQTTAPLNDEMAWAAGYLSQGAENLIRRAKGQDLEISARARAAAARQVMLEEQGEYARKRPVRNFVAQALGGAALGAGAGPTGALGRIGAGGAVGAGYGFWDAEGDVAERAPNALLGAAIGAAAVPAVERIVAPALGSTISALRSTAQAPARWAAQGVSALGVPGASRVAERLTPNALESSVSRFASRSPQQIDALSANAARFRAEGIEPTFADAIDDGGRGVLKAAATRQTPARQAAREFADQRAEGLQDRISTQARRTISDDARSPDEIRTAVSARRSREGDQAFGAVRGEVLIPEPQIVEALRTPAGRTAIEDAAVRASNRGDIETANQLRQLATDALDNPNGVQLTVGMADRIARTLNGLGEARRGTVTAPGDNDAAASFFSLAEALRGTARRQVPGYDEALRAYGDDSRLIQATSLGERFMTMEADQFAAAVAKLSTEERAVAQAAARRAVERAAGTQGAAPGVAHRLSGGREQGARTQALVDDPAAMQRAMATEREALRNAQAVNPAAGSLTNINQQDTATIGSAVIDGVTGGIPALAGRALKEQLKKARGFSDQEAEAIVLASIDPARTDELIGLLSQRMTRREARNLARALRYQITANRPQSQQR